MSISSRRSTRSRLSLSVPEEASYCSGAVMPDDAETDVAVPHSSMEGD